MDAMFETFKLLVRRGLPAIILVLAIGHAASAPAGSFDAFLAALWPDAEAKGITRTTFDAAFVGMTPDSRVIAAMQREPEYGKPMGAYIESIVSQSRIAIGFRKSARWSATLRAAAKQFGVEPTILVSIWGIESSFGDAPSCARWRRWQWRAFSIPTFATNCSAHSKFCSRTVFRVGNLSALGRERWDRASSCRPVI
jgi:membrane-bound lytic murein transglycosylase B